MTEEMPKEHALRIRSSWLTFGTNHFWLLFGGMWFAVGALFFCDGLIDWIQIGGLDERFQRNARTAVIMLKSWKRPSQVRVNLNTGAILK